MNYDNGLALFITDKGEASKPRAPDSPEQSMSRIFLAKIIFGD
jgi:hypothetical protein